ncbi:MAG: arginase [Bacteroidales bacterium]|nr:arginase [Bacteroidales bacterium]
MRKISVIEVRFGAAGKIEGAEEGARRLKEGIRYEGWVEDGGTIIPLAPPGDQGRLHNLGQMEEVTSRLREKAFKVFEEGNVQFILGGDHSCALGVMAAGCEFFGRKDYGILYVDAHGDINTPWTSSTGNIHGMCLATLMGVGEKEMTDLVKEKVLPENVLLIATRSLDEGEKDLIRKKGIQVIYADEIRREGIAETLRRIKGFINSRGIRHYHLSLDIDAVDPSEAPGTGVPEEKGISTQDFLDIVKWAVARREIVSADIMEFNPYLDEEGKTEAICRRASEIILA